MDFSEVYLGIVVSNKDPDEQGRIKIRVPDMMEGWQEELLPWARKFSFGTGGSDSFGASWIPEETTKVWIIFSDPGKWKFPYYIGDAEFKELNAAKVFSTRISKHVPKFLSKYPDVKFTILKNGVCFAMSSSDKTPEILLSNPKGNLIHLDSEGTIYVGNDSGGIKIDKSGDIYIGDEDGSGTWDQPVSFNGLKEFFDQVFDGVGFPLFQALGGLPEKTKVRNIFVNGSLSGFDVGSSA